MAVRLVERGPFSKLWIALENDLKPSIDDRGRPGHEVPRVGDRLRIVDSAKSHALYDGISWRYVHPSTAADVGDPVAHQRPTVEIVGDPVRVVPGGQSIHLRTVVQLHGATVTYAWTKEGLNSHSADSDGSFSQTDHNSTIFEIPEATQHERAYRIYCTITDGNSRTSIAFVDLHVAAVLRVYIQGPAAVTVDGGTSHPISARAFPPVAGTEITTWAWTADPSSLTPNITIPSNPHTSFTVPAATAAEQTVTLTVTITDEHGNTATDEVVLTIDSL